MLIAQGAPNRRYSIGSGGNFSSLSTAVPALRSKTTTLIATITASGTVNEYEITRSAGDSLSAYIGFLVGIRIDNATLAAPIVWGWVETASQLRVPHPLPATYTAITVEIYTVTPISLQYLPGTRDVLTANFTLDASFLTISALVPRTATLQMDTGVQIITDDTDNEIHWRGIILAGDLEEAFVANRILSGGGANTLAYLANWSFDDCMLVGPHIDIMYAQGSKAMASLRLTNCDVYSFFDAFNLAPAKQHTFYGNRWYAKAANVADFSGRVLAFATGGVGASPFTWAHQAYIFENNQFYLRVENTTNATPIIFNDQINSNATIRAANNLFVVNCVTGNSSIVGMDFDAAVTNPVRVELIDNTYDLTPSGTGTATFARSQSANIVIHEDNNRNVSSTSVAWGTNVVKRGYQAIAYAAAVTPDVTKGHIVKVGTLTGAITVNAPINGKLGDELEFMFLQDATGGRVITWNAAFKKAADGAGVLNQSGTTRYRHDGTNWIQQGGALAWFT